MNLAREIRVDDHDYPARLKWAAAPPARIFAVGPLDARITVAIVGSREPTEQSTAFARQLASWVVSRGWTVLSGGAKGIDAAAHEGALAAGGRTLAVLPCGPDRIYPRDNAALFANIVRQGSTLLWPLEPGRRVGLGDFYFRNRVLAALAHVLIVVQAKVQSGSLNAAKWAGQLGRPVWTVPIPPWPPFHETFGGNHLLLRTGAARALIDFSDLTPCVRGEAPQRRALVVRTIRDTKTLALPLHEARKPSHQVFAALDHEPRHADDVALRSGLPADAVSTALLTLALENVVVEGPSGFFRRH